MRIALVSPYSWSYPGGVNRHVEALAEQLGSEGHDVRVLAPLDPPGALTPHLHGGAAPQPLSVPDYLVPLGRTVGIRANGAVSNLSVTPHGVTTLLHELRRGRYDVVHIHEPVAPAIGWFAADRARLPLVGTFHAFSDRPTPNQVANLFGARRVLDRLHVRIAVSEAAAWTGRRWFGGDYRVIPNGVHVDPARVLRPAPSAGSDRLRIVFVGQPVERKGVPVLLRAFAGLREQIPAELVMVGPSPEQISSMMPDLRYVHALGKIDDDAKRRQLERADVLSAPSLGGESFGMVLTEAFAAGTPVVASDIAGYRDTVRDGLDGVLVPPGDPSALSLALRNLWAQPALRAQMARAGFAGVQRFAWPQVAAQVRDAYDEAILIAQPSRDLSVRRHRLSLQPANGSRMPGAGGVVGPRTDAGQASAHRRAA